MLLLQRCFSRQDKGQARLLGVRPPVVVVRFDVERGSETSIEWLGPIGQSPSRQ